MDAATLAKRKSLLKRQNTMDRSAPKVEEVNPGANGVLGAIATGHFELNHVKTDHDASAPMLEAGTGFHVDARPAIFAEVVQPGRRASLKATKSNDRSDPVLEKWVHIDVTSKPKRASLIDEIKKTMKKRIDPRSR